MNGYYGYYGYGYGPFVGAAPTPTASQLFAAIQQAMRTGQDVRGLVRQFNATRTAEGRYGGLSGAQLDPERNPNFPRRLVVWSGISRKSGGPFGYPLAPIGVFEARDIEAIESLSFALDDAANSQNSESIYGLGFEGFPEPYMLAPTGS